MEKLLFWFAVCCIMMASLPDFCQNPNKSSKDGWGSWRYTWQFPDELWSGILFRSKCVSGSGADSKWEYQFRSRYDTPIDFVEQEDHGVNGTTTNAFNQREIVTLDAGALSPVFETQLHGTCEELSERKYELKIEVICVTEHDGYGEGSNPCFEDRNGAVLDFKPIPDRHRYE